METIGRVTRGVLGGVQTFYKRLAIIFTRICARSRLGCAVAQVAPQSEDSFSGSVLTRNPQALNKLQTRKS